jgi:2,3-bisphosphoglycerate-independent phosphoglycerate mutase
MKYIILLGDGMGDYEIDELGGKTPLEAAYTPYMDYAASKGEIGVTSTIPPGFPKGSDVANLSIFGYDPKKYYSGRSPLEAASLGIKLEPADVSFRCNLVNLVEKNCKLIMNDFTAGHITSKEAALIIETLNEKLSSENITFFSGVSYRHIMLKKNGHAGLNLTPPHDITDKEIYPYLPDEDDAGDILQLMKSSWDILRDHEVNRARIKEGRLPANSIWLWGEGHAPKTPVYKEKYNLTGSVISAVDLIKGIGICAGLEPVNVPGATGYIDTDYAAKARYALKELREKDFVFLHVEAPDEAAHEGRLDLKLKAIEDFDEKVVKAVFKGMAEFPEYKIVILCDHFTPISLKTHTDDKVPVAVYDSRNELDHDRGFNEKAAKEGGLKINNAHDIMDYIVFDKPKI